MTVWFDSEWKNKNGKVIYDTDYVDVDSNNIYDGKLKWFHEGYGTMKLYRMIKVDDENYIAEDLKKICWTSSEEWPAYLENPSLALAS